MDKNTQKVHINLPNRLTIARFICVPFFAAVAYIAMRRQSRILYLITGILFLAAVYTDLLDGKIARKRGLITDFGKLMDPMADKLITTAAFLIMVEEGACNILVVLIIIVREFLVSALRMLASQHGNAIPANKAGKVKTFSQTMVIIAFYFAMALWGNRAVICLISNILCWILAALTVYSGVTYLWAGRKILKDSMREQGK